jgi:hypothetical protein
MFNTLISAWRAGRAGQPMPVKADRSAGQTGAIVGIAGVSVLVVFTVAYAFGAAEKRNRLAADDELKELEDDALAASAELRNDEKATVISSKKINGATVISAEEVDVQYEEEEGEEEESQLEQDIETGEISEREEPKERDGVDDLWSAHIDNGDEQT